MYAVIKNVSTERLIAAMSDRTRTCSTEAGSASGDKSINSSMGLKHAGICAWIELCRVGANATRQDIADQVDSSSRIRHG